MQLAEGTAVYSPTSADGHLYHVQLCCFMNGAVVRVLVSVSWCPCAQLLCVMCPDVDLLSQGAFLSSAFLDGIEQTFKLPIQCVYLLEVI